MSAEDTERLVRNPNLVDRPSYYFLHRQDRTPAGLGCPAPTGVFWSFFNCAEEPANNPIHRSHYFDGTLVHLDAVPWATVKPWSNLKTNHPDVATELTELALPVFYETLRNAPHLLSIFVRGRMAANFLGATGLLKLDFTPCPSDPRYQLAKGSMSLPDGRKIEVRAINHFQNISEAAAQALILL
jgi:hypothetical protein